MNIVIILDGVTLPTPQIPFKKVTNPNATDTVTLDGTLYTDFVNQRRSWTWGYASLSKAQYDVIRGIYDDQYTNEAYPILRIDYYGILTAAKLDINEANIWFDGECIRDVQLTLTEQYAFS